MSRKVRSARGEIVDFDLLQIKNQLASASEPVEVKQRQQFVEHRLKKKTKKAEQILQDLQKNKLEAETQVSTKQQKIKQKVKPKKG